MYCSTCVASDLISIMCMPMQYTHEEGRTETQNENKKKQY
jgi:hypothetical protein